MHLRMGRELGDGSQRLFKLVGDGHTGNGFDLFTADVNHTLRVLHAQVEIVSVVGQQPFLVGAANEMSELVQ